MPDPSLLGELIVTYAVALALIVVLARAGVPSVVSLILAGVLSGPGAFGIVRTPEQVDALAEVGIVLLLFTVGLEFSISEIRRAWVSILAGGLAQMTLTAAVAAGLLLALDVPPPVALLSGALVAFSSTALVLKELTTRGQLGAPYARLAVGVLLFQDLCVVFLLLLVPAFGGGVGATGIALAIARGAGALVVMGVGSRLVLPPLLRLVTLSGRHEAFPLAILLASIGTAWLSTIMGVPMALGAFLAGLMLAGGEFADQAYAEVRPLRDILTSLFFVSLGMLIDPAFLGAHVLVVGAGALGLVGIKAVLATTALRLTGTPLRTAAAAGVALAQVGEFSFVLGQTGLQAGVLDASSWQLLLAASILTMTVTPALVHRAPAVGSWLAQRVGAVSGGDLQTATAQEGHVVILGYGVGGQMVARSLEAIRVPFVVLELSGATVRRGRTARLPIVYADGTHPEALRAAGVERARAVVVMLSDPDATGRVLRALRRVAPAVPVFVRTRYRLEAQRFEHLGAAVAVAEESEASLELLGHVLGSLDAAPETVATIVSERRAEMATAPVTPRPERS